MTLTAGFIYLGILIVLFVLWLLGITQPADVPWRRHGWGLVEFILFCLLGWTVYGGVHVVR